MALYYDAATLLSVNSQEGSLKSRIYDTNSKLKSKPAHLYALISETAKYDVLLKELIENAGILALEPKLNPLLSLLLVHDHFFSKRGISAPAGHPLRQAVERHKARLQAELTKSRLRRSCANIDQLKKLLQTQNKKYSTSKPRWVRVNRVKSDVAHQLKRTFAGYIPASSLIEVIGAGASNRVFRIDDNISDLVALPPGVDLTKTEAYKNGEIILQDKASCIPAYLLLASGADAGGVPGDIIDACAAPGNKTTHLASIIYSQQLQKKGKIFACERDPGRSKTLQNMVNMAGAGAIVKVLPNQDFLALDPEDDKFKEVTHLLLDPSCSGSGIIGREDLPTLALPEKRVVFSGDDSKQSRKRKRNDTSKDVHNPSKEVSWAGLDEEGQPSVPLDTTRLEKLSNLQLRIIEHAFEFPAARFVTYSTCSIHAIENEGVVSRAVRSSVAQTRGWRVLRRDEQIAGLRDWQRRGASPNTFSEAELDGEMLSEAELQGCLRCDPGTEEGTMGFFVCMFIRDDRPAQSSSKSRNDTSEEEWEGFSSD